MSHTHSSPREPDVSNMPDLVCAGCETQNTVHDLMVNKTHMTPRWFVEELHCVECHRLLATYKDQKITLF